MKKTIVTPEHRLLASLLRHYREKAGLRQIDLAERLDVARSYVSDCETGEKRIDLVELRSMCEALGISLVGFVRRFESELLKP